jgi:phosphoribosylformylglycinamidine synthase
LDDASRVMKIGFRAAGDVILLLDGAISANGTQHAAPLQKAEQSFSSSEYAKRIGGIVAGEPPAIDLAAEKRLIDCLVALAAEGRVQSAHDVSDGGIAVTLAESCFAARGSAKGASVALDDEMPAELALFGERGARCVVSVAAENVGVVLATARQYGVEGREIGKVTADSALRIEMKGRAVVESTLDSLYDAWANSLERMVIGK